MYNKSQQSNLIWANLLHLSTNMWEDHPHFLRNGVSADFYRDDFEPKSCNDAIAWAMRAYRPYLIHDETVWSTVVQKMADIGMNMVVIDLGDAVKYESHPEIAVRNAWSTEKLRMELNKIRELGLEPIPKLNFATSHDAWLGEYGRMVSTSKYYKVCSNLISEVIELFDTPRFFHIGMDEEVFQRTYIHNIIRQHDLWWHDLYFYIDEIEKKGVRAWVWPDAGWRNPETFFKKMPKSVLQSNWYYLDIFDLEKFGNNENQRIRLNFYSELEARGYDQIPTGSNFYNDQNMEPTVEYCKKIIDPSRLLGFMTAPWLPNLQICLDKHLGAITQIQRAMNSF